MSIKDWLIEKGVRLVLPKNIIAWIDGKKSLIGLIGLLVCVVLSAFGVTVPDNILKIFEIITGIGLADKARKLNESVNNLKATFNDVTKE